MKQLLPKQTPCGLASKRPSATFAQNRTPSRPDPTRDGNVANPAPVPATEARYVGPKWTGPPAELKSHERAIRHEALARAIATRQLTHLHELAHIDYDLCLDDPDVRAVVAEALRWGALTELEAA